jgi:hypothetical protein
VSTLTREQRILRDCTTEVRGLLGAGYVPDFYSNLAGPFAAIVEFYVAEAVAAERERLAGTVEAFADADGVWIGPTDPDSIMRRAARLIRETQ